MSQMNKLAAAGILLLGMLAFSGCGQKNNTAPAHVAPSVQKEGERTTNGANSNAIEKENLQPPTGKISDTLNAINSEVDSEKSVVSEEDEDAQGAVNDKTETDDFGATYNENEL